LARLLVAEFNNRRDTNYRLFDWNRLGNGGKPRNCTIEQSLGPSTSRLARGGSAPASYRATHVERLVACDKFVLDRWSFAKPDTIGATTARTSWRLCGKVAIAGDPRSSPGAPAASSSCRSLGPVTSPQAERCLVGHDLPYR